MGRHARALGAPSAAPLAELGYAQVRFADGPLARQAQENHRFLLDLDEDALLFPFRTRAGQRAPGRDLGGWYGTYEFAPGATFGQWLSALARHSAISGDEASRAKLGRLVLGYAATLDSRHSFYTNNRFPSYTYDKLVGGLVDAKCYANTAHALDSLQSTTRAALPYLPPHAMPRNEHSKPGEDFSEHAWDESYTIPENQFLAWQLTGDGRHRALARRFLYDDFFGALARHENVLPGKHAYSHVNALSSSAQAYLSLGSREYLDATRNGFDMIDAQSFATGGWGPDEHFVVPGGGGLGASIEHERKSFETPCGAYAHFKLTRYLLRITRDARYGDSMERVLYNTVLGAKPIQADGRAFYYSDYSTRAQKGFHPDRWPCCSGTLPMIAADYRISACFTDAQGIYVNLYAPGVTTWRQRGVSCALTTQTDYPYASEITLVVRVPRPQTFCVRTRIPQWAQGAEVRINGKAGQAVVPGTFAALMREWRDGDRIEIDLPLRQRVQSVDAEHPDWVALLGGPLVLMRMLEDDAPAPITRASLLTARRDYTHDREWRIREGDKLIRLRPFTEIGDESYSVYQRSALA
ncbi:MAG: beta-L-arabinofuranosidase domain-containing protein [Rudaea sp.]